MNTIVDRVIAAAVQIDLQGLDMSANLEGDLHLALLGLVETIYRWREAHDLRLELEEQGVAAGSLGDAAYPPQPDGTYAERVELLIDAAYQVADLTFGPVALRMSPGQTVLFTELEQAVAEHSRMAERAALAVENGTRPELLPGGDGDDPEPRSPDPGSLAPWRSPSPTRGEEWHATKAGPVVRSDADTRPDPGARLETSEAQMADRAAAPDDADGITQPRAPSTEIGHTLQASPVRSLSARRIPDSGTDDEATRRPVAAPTRHPRP